MDPTVTDWEFILCVGMLILILGVTYLKWRKARMLLRDFFPPYVMNDPNLAQLNVLLSEASQESNGAMFSAERYLVALFEGEPIILVYGKIGQIRAGEDGWNSETCTYVLAKPNNWKWCQTHAKIFQAIHSGPHWLVSRVDCPQRLLKQAACRRTEVRNLPASF